MQNILQAVMMTDGENWIDIYITHLFCLIIVKQETCQVMQVITDRVDGDREGGTMQFEPAFRYYLQKCQTVCRVE